MSKDIEYLCEAGVSYRHLHYSLFRKSYPEPKRGEVVRRYQAIYHPTKKVFERRIAMPDDGLSLLGFLKLLNHWNGRGDWSYAGTLEGYAYFPPKAHR